MKLFLIFSAIVALAFILRVVDVFTSRRKIKSLGANSNNASKDIPRVDVADPEDLKRALDYYRDMLD